MRINPIALKTTFKSNDFIKLGYDDEISEARREFIRENYRSYAMPYYSILENNNRLEEYELKKLIASLYGVKVNSNKLGNLTELYKKTANSELIETTPEQIIDFEAIQKLPLYNVEVISDRLGAIRGQTLNGTGYLKALKNAGVERVIDLVGYELLEEDCYQFGLEFLYYPVSLHFMRNSYLFKTRQENDDFALNSCRKFGYTPEQTSVYLKKARATWQKKFSQEIEYFIEFITTMQKGKLYIGCECGTYTTDNALMLNSFFNPDYKNTSQYITYLNKHFIKNFESLYNNLTAEHKLRMGWTSEFDASLINKIRKASKI